MAVVFANNAFGTLAIGIGAEATVVQVLSGQGGRFPALQPGDVFYATLANTANELEIVRCTARNGDIMTIERGQEGTTARSYIAGDRIEVRLTAAGLSDFLQASSNTTFTGDIAFTKLVNFFEANALGYRVGNVLVLNEQRQLQNVSIPAALIDSGTLGVDRIPTITTGMLGDSQVTGSKLAPGAVIDSLQNGSVRGRKLMRIEDAPIATVVAASPGIEVVLGTSRTSGTTFTGSTGFVQATRIVIGKYTGTMRFTFAHRGKDAVSGFAGNPSSASVARILRNGIQVATWTSPSNSSVQVRTTNLSVAAGDVFTLEHRATVSTASGSRITADMQVFANNVYTVVTPVELTSNL